MAASRRLIAAVFGAALALEAGAQSAWDQAKALAGPNYRPPDLPTPTMKCETCSSRPAPSAATRPPAAARTPASAATPPLGVTLGAAIFGSILQQAFSFDLGDGKPDPAELARQEAARREAEAEAKRRAAEEEARHRALLASFKTLPQPTAAPVLGPGNTLGLKALAMLDATRSSESLREEASAGWDSPRLRFAMRHRPWAVSDPLPILPSQTVCAGSGCRWPAAGVPAAIHVSGGPARVHRMNGQTIVDLIAAGQKPQSNPRDLVMARLRTSPPQNDARLIAELRRLWDKSRATLAELVWAVGGLFIDEYVPGGKGIMLIKDVYQLADETLADATKVAGWLGSPDLDAPPEIRPLEEAARPFLFRGITENEALAEGVKKGFTILTEGSNLAKNLMEIWEVR